MAKKTAGLGAVPSRNGLRPMEAGEWEGLPVNRNVSVRRTSGVLSLGWAAEMLGANRLTEAMPVFRNQTHMHPWLCLPPALLSLQMNSRTEGV